MRRALGALLAVAALVLVVGVAPAAAKAPCWKTLLNDWLVDGRVDKVYAIPCYRAAIARLPEDVDTYSSAKDDINRALQAAIAGRKPPPAKGGNSGNGSKGSGGTPAATTNGGSHGGNEPPATTATTPGSTEPRTTTERPQTGPVNEAIKSLGPDDASSVPIPLLVLAGLALLLLAAGSIGFAVRRVQARRLPVRPGPPAGSD